MTSPDNFNGVELDSDYLLRLREIVSRTKVRRANLGGHSGNIAGQKRGRGSIFYDVRPWSEGDDIRHIDSYKTARTGIPHIRTSHEDRENKIILLVDLRSSMFFGTRRAFRSIVAAEAISITGWRAVSARDQIGLAVATSHGMTFVGWANDAHKFSDLLERLAIIYSEARNSSGSSDPYMDEVMEFGLGLSGSARIIIATALDAPGENFDKITRMVAKRRELIFLLISDTFERRPPVGYYPYRSCEGESGVIHISRQSTKKTFNDWPERLSRLGARSLAIDSELGPQEMVRELEGVYDRSR